jgi:hypothetical protein
MLLVVIAALAIALVMERARRVRSEEMARANQELARVEADEALAQARQAEVAFQQAQAQLRKALDEAKRSNPGPRGESRASSTAGGDR